MAQHSVLEVAGLYTADNPYSAVPRGALVKAENAILTARNRVGPRRGQRYWGTEAGVTFGGGSDRSNEGYHWGSAGTVFHYATTALARAVGSTITDYSGSYTAVDAATLRMKFVEAALNLYFNTNAGVYLLESITGTPALAGVPSAFGDFNSGGYTSLTNLYSAAGWMPADTACAYRYVWGTKDSHDNVKLGAPSGRLVVRNRLDVVAGSVSRAANVVTVNSGAQAHGLTTGDSITLLNTDATFTAGTYGPITVTGATTFTYAQVAANATSAATLKYATARDTALYPYIPPGITTSHFVRIYRSEETASADDTPSDDMYLVNEVRPTSADISAGVIAFVADRTPSSRLGPPAYWNPDDGEGLEASKYRPPIGKDMCLWDGRMWAINTKDKHRFHLRLLGIGSPDGLQNNDTITIGGKTFTGSTSSSSYSTFQFGISASNLNTAAQNIRLTCEELINCLNYNYASTGVVAYYESGDDGDPGMIVLEEYAVGGSAYYVAASRTATWGPVPPQSKTIAIGGLTRAGSTVTATTGSAHGFSTGQQVLLCANTADANYSVGLKTITVTGATTFTYSGSGTVVASLTAYVVHAISNASVNDSRPHGVAYSDTDEPEAFRLTSWEPVAPKGVGLLRGVPHRDKLYLFAEDGKAYTVSGPFPYRVDELEGSALVLAADTVQVHAGRVYALTNQGVGVLTDAGFEPVSGPVDDDILDVQGLTLATVKRYAFAVSYETEKQYQLWLPLTSAATCATKGFVWSSRERAWVGTHTANRTWGRVNASDGKLYLGDGGANKLRVERKALDRTDYADEAVAVTVAAFTSTTVSLSGSPDVAVGDLIYQPGYLGAVGLVTAIAVSAPNTVCTVTPSGGAWDAGFATTGAALVLKAYSVAVKWAPVAPGGPRVLKDFQDVTLHFRELNAYALQATFDTETYVTEDTADVKQVGYSLSVPAAESGLFTGPPNNRNRRVEVTADHHSAAQLRVGVAIREAWALWQLHGFTLQYGGGGDGGRA